jgi:hypothetical protein
MELETLQAIDSIWRVIDEIKQELRDRKNKESLDKRLNLPALLSLPDHLRKTASVLAQLGSVRADDVAEKTHRARAVESAYLNQLVLMGHAKKVRAGRKVLFLAELKQT